MDRLGSVLAATALVGGVIGLGALLCVGFIEETAKVIVPLGVLAATWQRSRSPVDGLLVGLASGLGFAVLEAMGYAFVALVRAGGNLGTVEQQQLLLRGLLAPAGHAAWTGLLCAAIWQTALRPGVRSALALVATYLTWS